MQRIWNILNFPIKFHFPLKFNFKPILICMLQRHIQRIRDLIAMKEEDRHSLLRYLTADEYRDIINVCSSLPYVTMEVHSTGIYIYEYTMYIFKFLFPMWLLKFPHLTYHWHIGPRYHCFHLCLSLATVLAWLLKCFTEIIFWGSIPCTSQYMCTLQYVMYCDCQNWIELFFWISEPF